MNIRLDKTSGYLYFIEKGHPLADRRGKIYHHRYVASLKHGRWLSSDEHVHHVDGDRSNNDPDNLEVMAPSEHHKFHGLLLISTRDITANCKQCDKICRKHKNGRDSFCNQECFHSYYKHFDPSSEALQVLVWSMPTTKVAALFGVSDTAIAKRCNRLGIIKPNRGYWRKLETGKIQACVAQPGEQSDSKSEPNGTCGFESRHTLSK